MFWIQYSSVSKNPGLFSLLRTSPAPLQQFKERGPEVGNNNASSLESMTQIQAGRPFSVRWKRDINTRKDVTSLPPVVSSPYHFSYITNLVDTQAVPTQAPLWTVLGQGCQGSITITRWHTRMRASYPLVSSLLGCPPRRPQQRATALTLLRNPLLPSHSRVRPLSPALKDRRRAPQVRADPPLRDPASLPFPPPPVPPLVTTRLFCRERDAVSIFEYPCVVTAMTSLRITGESRA